MKQAIMALLLCASSLYAAAQGGFPSPVDYDVYRGSVSIKNFGDHMIGIVVVDERGHAGGWVHLFRFWTEAPLNAISVNAAGASIEYRGRELVILVPERQLFYTFVLSDTQFGAPAPPAGFTGIRYVGYGLNHEVRPVRAAGATNGRRVAVNDICDDSGIDCYLNPDPDGSGGTGGGSCDSGGPGANACSITSTNGNGCSVGCTSGYYACCSRGGALTYPYCYCVHQ